MIPFSSHKIISIPRGGDSLDADGHITTLDDDDEDESEITSEDEDEEEAAEDDEDITFMNENDNNNDENENDEDEDNEEDDEEEVEETSKIPTTPLKILIKTNIDSPLIDQTLELTASRNRDIASLKLSIYRQMRGRPPVASQKLLLGARVLRDDEILNDLAPEEDDDEEDEDEDEDDSTATVTLILDIPPPIDPKFATDLRETLESMTTAEILDAYVANTASMERVSRWAFEEAEAEEDTERDDEESENPDISTTATTTTVTIPDSIAMRKHAMMVKERILSTFSEDSLKLLEVNNGEEDDNDGFADPDSLLAESIRRKTRVKLKGGAKMMVKKSLQKNLNINWPATIRTCLLFLFFGHFGARNSLTRLFMLWGAPLSFIIQLRPVKIALKQLFYAVGEPPGIILSLLPAPQQAIMGLDYKSAMRELYGDSGIEGEEGEEEGKMEGEEEEEEEEDKELTEDDEYDEYDEEE